MDHNHGRLYIYTADSRPRMTFLPKNMPQDLSRQYEDEVLYKVRASRNESIRDFFREACEQLQMCTEVVLVGPGTAKDELTRWLHEKGRFSDIPIRTYTSAWMDEPSFEAWARETLNVPKDTALIFLKRPREGVRRRLGGPGAPVSPEQYHRTNEVKNNGWFTGRKATD
jgi:hypothetical protein